LIVFCTVLTSCQTIHPQRNHYKFQSLLVDKDITGSILIYDLNKNIFYSNDFNWANIGRVPASTFKIPNSLIALELGIIEDENTLFKWNGDKSYLKIWQQNLTLKQAFHYSCVPCYQEIARKIGDQRMNEYVKKLNFGHMDIRPDNKDDFWLHGKSKINQFEEINFLRRLYNSQLPISERTEHIFKQMFIIKQIDEYTLRGKTGLAVRDKSYNGWYVGYLETNNNVYFFATNISPVGEHDNTFNNKRKNITIDALKQLGINL
jgi:beta-lactamase class D